MNIQQPAEDSRVNCGLCQNLDQASSIMGCSYWLAGHVNVCVCKGDQGLVFECVRFLSWGIGCIADPGSVLLLRAVYNNRQQTLGRSSGSLYSNETHNVWCPSCCRPEHLQHVQTHSLSTCVEHGSHSDL